MTDEDRAKFYEAMAAYYKDKVEPAERCIFDLCDLLKSNGIETPREKVIADRIMVYLKSEK